MKKRFSPTMVMFMFAILNFASQVRSSGQHGANQENASFNIPAELVWITLFTDKIQKNPQGYWEVELGDGIEMVYVPAGDFLMGAPRGEVGWEEGEGPVHRVFIKGILIGKVEVTREIWRAVLGGGVRSEEMGLPQGDVSYDDIQKFLLALEKKSGLAFRLPTEAEWEKCCRGGSSGPDYGPTINEIAWNARNSGDKPHRVGSKRPNGFGIFDMLGNVWEWCSDWYSASYYYQSPYLNPTGPEEGTQRVQRGGGFRHCGNYLRCAHRNCQDPAISKPQYGYGFRLVLDLELQ